MIRCTLCLALSLVVASPAAAQSGSLHEEVPAPFGEAPIGGGVIAPRGWAVEAFWIGIASVLGVLTTGIAAVAIASPDDRDATGLGLASMSLLAITAPTVALGGASARSHPYVPGAPGVRLAGWITFSLSLVSGVGLLLSDIDQNGGPRGAFIAPVALGAISLLLFAFDALISAVQADLVSGDH